MEEFLLEVHELDNGNKIYVGDKVSLNAKTFTFTPAARKAGGNNVLYLEGNLNLRNSTISFRGSNSAVFVRPSIFAYKFNIVVFSNSAVHIGRNNFINHSMGAPMNILASEEMNVFMGDGCFTSLGIWIRTSDGHLIYSMDTYERLNTSRGIYIGDHVWLGQDVRLFKGTQIGSGSIVGANALISGKKIPSNTAWAGIPASQLKDRIFWTGRDVGTWTKEDKDAHQKLETDKFNYERDANSLSFDELDQRLSACETSDDKLKILLELSKNQSKNRFAI